MVTPIACNKSEYICQFSEKTTTNELKQTNKQYIPKLLSMPINKIDLWAPLQTSAN